MVETTEAYGFTAVCVLIVCALIFSRNYLLSVFKLTVSKVISGEASTTTMSNKIYSLSMLSNILGFLFKVLSCTTGRFTSRF